MEVITLSIILVFLLKVSKALAGLIFDRQFKSQCWCVQNTDMLKMVASISHNPRAGGAWLDVDTKWSTLHFQLLAAYLSSSAKPLLPALNKANADMPKLSFPRMPPLLKPLYAALLCSLSMPTANCSLVSVWPTLHCGYTEDKLQKASLRRFFMPKEP